MKNLFALSIIAALLLLGGCERSSRDQAASDPATASEEEIIRYGLGDDQIDHMSRLKQADYVAYKKAIDLTRKGLVMRGVKSLQQYAKDREKAKTDTAAWQKYEDQIEADRTAAINLAEKENAGKIKAVEDRINADDKLSLNERIDARAAARQKLEAELQERLKAIDAARDEKAKAFQAKK